MVWSSLRLLSALPACDLQCLAYNRHSRNLWVLIAVLFFICGISNALEVSWQGLSGQYFAPLHFWFSNLGEKRFTTSRWTSSLPALAWSKSFLKSGHSDYGVRVAGRIDVRLMRQGRLLMALLILPSDILGTWEVFQMNEEAALGLGASDLCGRISLSH